MKVNFCEVIIMKLFGYFLIFTVCLTVGVLSFVVSDYPNQRRLIECSGDRGMKSGFSEDDGWVSAYGELDGLSNPKVPELLKLGKGANYSSPSLGEPARLHKLP